MKDQSEIMHSFIFAPRIELNFKAHGGLSWLLFFLLLSNLFVPTATKPVRKTRESNEPAVSTLVEVYPAMTNVGLFTARSSYPWWYTLAIEEDKNFVPNKKFNYLNFPIIGKAAAAAEILEYLEQAFQDYSDPVILEELALIRKGTPELQFIPLQNYKTGDFEQAKYVYYDKKILIRTDVNAPKEKIKMSGMLIHELSHAYTNLLYELFAVGNVVDRIEEINYPSGKERENYKKLWKKGDNRLKKYVDYLNEFYQLKKKSVKNTEEKQRFQQLDKKLRKLRKEAKDLIDKPYFTQDIALPLPKTYIAGYKNLGIQFEVNRIVDLDNHITPQTGSGLKRLGELKIINVVTQKDKLIIYVVPQDSAIAFIEYHNRMLQMIDEYSPYQLNHWDERRAYARQWFPRSLVKYIWREVEQYETERRQQATEKLSDAKISTVLMSDNQRYQIIVEKIDKYVHKIEKGIQLGHFNPHEQAIISQLGNYYDGQAAALLEINQLEKAEQVIAKIVFSKNLELWNKKTYMLVAQYNFYIKNYAQAVEYFEKVEAVDLDFLLTFYPEDTTLYLFQHGIALLQINNPDRAVEKLTTAYELLSKNNAIPEELVTLCRRQLDKALAAVSEQSARLKL